MLITVKNNGKGSQGIYANGETKATFVPPKGSKRFTIADEAELERIRRIPTLVIIEHKDGEDEPLKDDGSNSDVLTTTGNDGPDLGDTVEHPVLDTGDNGDAADQPEGADKPWEAPAPKGGKKK